MIDDTFGPTTPIQWVPAARTRQPRLRLPEFFGVPMLITPVRSWTPDGADSSVSAP